jgi:hypothetical protein
MYFPHLSPKEASPMKDLPLESVAALTAGILILLLPQLLNYLVAVYLIVVGVLGLANRS